jgi:hypothetical protein
VITTWVVASKSISISRMKGGHINLWLYLRSTNGEGWGGGVTAWMVASMSFSVSVIGGAYKSVMAGVG